MLVIRKPQMEILARDARADFVHRLVEHLATQYPDAVATAGKGAVVDLVGRAIDRGALHGIETEAEVFALAELMIEVGEDFERFPDKVWAQRVLAHPTLPGSLKIDALTGRIFTQTQGRVVERA